MPGMKVSPLELLWRRRCRQERLVSSICHQIKACTTSLPPIQSMLMTAWMAHTNWQVDRAGSSFSTAKPAASDWVTVKPSHAAFFLIYRPDREGD